MIQEFSIENTLSIKDRQTISFEAANGNDKSIHIINTGGKKLLKLAAIYGANAAGKSNIITAFNSYIQYILLSFTYLKPKDKTKFIPFLFDNDTVRQPGCFEIIFYHDKIEYEYKLILDSRCIFYEHLYYRPKKQKKLIFERICDSPYIEWENLKYKWRWGSLLTGDKKTFSSMTRHNVPFLTTTAQLKHPFMEKIYNYFSSIYLPIIIPSDQGLGVYTAEYIDGNMKSKKEVLSFLETAALEKIADIRAKDVEFPDSVVEKFPEIKQKGRNVEGKYTLKEIQFLHEYNGSFALPIFEESQGTQRLFELSGPLFTAISSSKFLCIDEIEASLHDDLLEYYIKTFLTNSANSQMIFTTHNQNLLDSELLRNDEIWFAEKGEDGGSRFYSLAEFKGVKKGVSRRELYKAGRFGALPLTGTFSKES